MTSVLRDVRREHRLVLDDGWIHITEWGVSEADVTVILTHGWSLSSRVWETVAAAIVRADPSLRVVVYDHRGHGNSARTSDASIEHLADDLGRVIDESVPHGPIVFGGHSLGGMTLMALAQHRPELVVERTAGVVFVATSAGHLLGAIRRIPGTELVMRGALVLASRLRPPSRPLLLLRQGARGAFGKHPRRHDLNRAVLQAAQADPRAVAALGRSILQHHRYDAVAVFRRTNVVVLAGSRDWLTSPAHAARIADRLPSSRVVVFPGAGHFLPYERHQAVTAHLLNLTAQARRVGAGGVEMAG